MSVGISQNRILQEIQTAQNGTARPFRVVLKKNGRAVSAERHATRHLAWASGENWKMLNPENSYEIEETEISIILMD